MISKREREILRYLGYRGQDLPEEVKVLIRSCEDELEHAAAPKAFWREYPLTARGEELDLTVMQVKSRNLAKNLDGCRQVLLFAATLGSGVDLLLHRYSRLQMSRCVVLQAAAAAYLEEYCDSRNEMLRREYAKQGKFLRPRFSPGYGDFSLEHQASFFSALELPKRIGITLTDSLLMVPSKSVTAVIGISDTDQGCKTQGCEACPKTDCAYRR